MITCEVILRGRRRPIGRRVCRAIGRAACHVVAAVLLTAAAVWLVKEPVSTGLHDRFAYGLERGTLVVGGAPSQMLGMISCDASSWKMRGVGGSLGVLMVATIERTGDADIEGDELLTATRRFAAANPEPRELSARAWASVGSVTLFEPSPRVWVVVGLTLAAGAVGWSAFFLTGRAGWRRWRALAESRRAKAGACRACGYPLGGLGAAAACPECGVGPVGAADARSS